MGCGSLTLERPAVAWRLESGDKAVSFMSWTEAVLETQKSEDASQCLWVFSPNLTLRDQMPRFIVLVFPFINAMNVKSSYVTDQTTHAILFMGPHPSTVSSKP